MRSITIDIINENAIRLLEDLELMQLIHLHKDDLKKSKKVNWSKEYKGMMTKESKTKVDNQLRNLRNG
ncbi:MAG: hypothetical protein IPL23_16670 [Saprospiraceae bacterium]|nr:hypothetical protein [Saprospiraceae bacterium]MBK8635351.1 hypothetical protein [Saprospiraceae bacterium]MBP7642187.1 hypothetical protein [Saprospiraceae bacterium]